MTTQDVNEYFTADDPNYAERLNNPSILVDVFTIKPKITLPSAFKAGVYPDHEHKTKAHFSIIQVKNNTCNNTGDGFTATNNNQGFTLTVYPNFSSFKWWNKIIWEGEGTITCQMKDTSTGTVLIADISSGSNLNSHDIPHKQVDIIFTLQNGARVTNITLEYENQPKLIGTEWSFPKDNITGLNSELNNKADKSTVDNLTTVVGNKADQSAVTSGLASKLDASVYTAADVLNKIKTVHGAGSGLDADLLDGLNSTDFVRSTVPSTSALANRIPLSDSGGKIALGWLRTGHNNGLDADLLDGNHASHFLPASSYTAADVLNKIKTVHGAGSGLDADLLDGLNSTDFVRSTVPSTSALANRIPLSDSGGKIALGWLRTGHNNGLDADLLDGQHASHFLPATSYTAADVLTKIKTVHGAGSGLDADLLDGLNSTNFLQKSTPHSSHSFNRNSSNPLMTWDFTNLNGDADTEYQIEFSLWLPTNASLRRLQILPNNISTDVQTRATVAGTTISLHSSTDGSVGTVLENTTGNLTGVVKLRSILNADGGREVIGEYSIMRNGGTGLTVSFVGAYHLMSLASNLTYIRLRLNTGSMHGTAKLTVIR